MGTSGVRWEDWGVACREGKKTLVEEMRKGNENFSHLSEILTMPAPQGAGGGAGGGTGDKEERKHSLCFLANGLTSRRQKK